MAGLWRTRGSALAVVLAVMCIWAPAAQPQATPAPAAIERVVIETASGAHTFKAEIADTPALRERGLMFRHKLPADRAMLFDWGDVRVATMWMRNTFVALDMIFISSTGHIERIAENTEPQSLEIISSRVPVAAVLEVAAGTAARLGIKPGDKVVHRMFKAN